MRNEILKENEFLLLMIAGPIWSIRPINLARIKMFFRHKLKLVYYQGNNNRKSSLANYFNHNFFFHDNDSTLASIE